MATEQEQGGQNEVMLAALSALQQASRLAGKRANRPHRCRRPAFLLRLSRKPWSAGQH